MRKIALILTSATTFPSSNRVINWKGQNWVLKTGQAGPGNNNWSASVNNVWVDDFNKLHMKIKNDGGRWDCTEFDSQYDYLYGKFTWKVDSPVFNLDKNSVLGFFTYENDSQEVDIEISRWQRDSNNLLWFTVQPSTNPGNSNNFLPSKTEDGVTTTQSGYNGTGMILQYDWQPTYVDFKAWDNNGTLISSMHFMNVSAIPKCAQNLKMNLWLRQPPSDGHDIEVVVSDLQVEATPVKQTPYNGAVTWSTIYTQNLHQTINRHQSLLARGLKL